MKHKQDVYLPFISAKNPVIRSGVMIAAKAGPKGTVCFY